MNDIPFVVTWYGKNLEDCTREELIECVRYLNDLYEKEKLLKPKKWINRKND